MHVPARVDRSAVPSVIERMTAVPSVIERRRIACRSRLPITQPTSTSWAPSTAPATSSPSAGHSGTAAGSAARRRQAVQRKHGAQGRAARSVGGP